VQVPKKLEEVVLRGLSRDRSKRYLTRQELRDDLEQSLGRQDLAATMTRRVLVFTVDNFLLTMLSRSDGRRGLHDLLSGTYVVPR